MISQTGIMIILNSLWELMREQMLKVTGFIHVNHEPLNGDISNGLLEEELFDGGSWDAFQLGQHEEEFAKAEWLSRVWCLNVFAQSKLCLVLQRCNGVDIAYALHLRSWWWITRYSWKINQRRWSNNMHSVFTRLIHNTLTGFENDNAFQTSIFCSIHLHGLELGNNFLQSAYLRPYIICWIRWWLIRRDSCGENTVIFHRWCQRRDERRPTRRVPRK